jgi:hypothetical protein
LSLLTFVRVRKGSDAALNRLDELNPAVGRPRSVVLSLPLRIGTVEIFDAVFLEIP